jgi:predicted Zn-dependent protease
MNNSVTSLQSISPSIMSGASLLKPASIPSKPSTRGLLRKERSDKALSDLWLLTAQLFIKLGKLGEARKAIEEAENVDWTNNAQVWCMLGRLLLAEGKDREAHAAFQKALVVDSNDTNARVELAKSYMKQNEQELAEGILDFMTKSNAWDCAEAW